ncbi:MAG: PulJ/GspJ family protein [Gemmatimonadaceae bacterium]
MIRSERGAALLEVIVALTILAVAGVSAVAMASGAARTVHRAREADAEMRRASAFFDVVALWTRADLDRHLGERPQGAWTMRVDRIDPELYAVSLSDTATKRLLLATELFRPEVRDEAR